MVEPWAHGHNLLLHTSLQVGFVGMHAWLLLAVLRVCQGPNRGQWRQVAAERTVGPWLASDLCIYMKPLL
jgi:O-antigen ligase